MLRYQVTAETTATVHGNCRPLNFPCHFTKVVTDPMAGIRVRV